MFKDFYHERNGKVLAEIKQIPRTDSFFRRIFCDQVYDPSHIAQVVKEQTGFEIRDSEVPETRFLLEDPANYSGVDYSKWINLDFMAGYDHNIPVLGICRPPRFAFKSSRIGLILRVLPVDILETKLGPVPANVRIVRTSSMRELNHLLNQGFNIKSEVKKNYVSRDIDGMPLGLRDYQVYTCVRDGSVPLQNL